MIGFILPDITNPFFPEVLASFDRETRKLGYTCFCAIPFLQMRRLTSSMNGNHSIWGY